MIDIEVEKDLIAEDSNTHTDFTTFAQGPCTSTAATVQPTCLSPNFHTGQIDSVFPIESTIIRTPTPTRTPITPTPTRTPIRTPTPTRSTNNSGFKRKGTTDQLPRENAIKLMETANSTLNKILEGKNTKGRDSHNAGFCETLCKDLDSLPLIKQAKLRAEISRLIADAIEG